MDGRPSPGPWRHRRVWLVPALRPAVFGGLDDPADRRAVLDWARAGRPFIGRGALPGDAPGGLPLGLALPPQPHKRRLSLTVAAAVVREVVPPPTLQEALGGLPPRLWRAAARLVARAGDLPVHVYGSAFWQQASGLPYLRDDSDLDLLARPTSAAAARAWLRLLADVQLETGVRLDGEVELPSGEAVAWRELATETATLLVKSDGGPCLRPRAAVWGAWDAEEEAC